MSNKVRVTLCFIAYVHFAYYTFCLFAFLLFIYDLWLFFGLNNVSVLGKQTSFLPS